MRTLLMAVTIAVVPVCAQAQCSSVPKGEAEKVATIIRSDKAKTHAYCDLQKLAKQIRKANQKKDRKRIREIAENEELRAEFVLTFHALAKMCTR